MASLAAISGTTDVNYLNNIKVSERPGYFLVRLFQPHRNGLRQEPTPHWIEVDTCLPFGDDGQALYAGSTFLDGPIGVGLVEKALVLFNDRFGVFSNDRGYKGIQKPANLKTMLTVLTGRKPKVYSLDPVFPQWLQRSRLFAVLRSSQGKQPLVFGSRHQFPDNHNPFRLLEGHAYAFEGLIEKDGSTHVKLRDPQGVDGPFRQVPWDALREYFKLMLQL